MRSPGDTGLTRNKLVRRRDAQLVGARLGQWAFTARSLIIINHASLRIEREFPI